MAEQTGLDAQPGAQHLLWRGPCRTTERASREIWAHGPGKGPASEANPVQSRPRRTQLLPPSPLWSFSLHIRITILVAGAVSSHRGKHLGFLSTGLGAGLLWHSAGTILCLTHKGHPRSPQGSFWATDDCFCTTLLPSHTMAGIANRCPSAQVPKWP